MKLRRLNTGNYFGWFNGYYFFIYRRPHGKWCSRIGMGGEWLLRGGNQGAYLTKAKLWTRNQILLDTQL